MMAEFSHHGLLPAGGDLDTHFLVTIRTAQLSDLDSLIHVEMTCFDADRLTRRSIREWIRRPHGRFLLAEVDETLAGVMLLILPRNRAWARIYSIAVMPQFRGQGIAQQLMEYGETVAVSENRQRLILEVKHSNRNAIALYQARGYSEFGRYSEYYADKSDAIRMEKFLHTESQVDHKRS